MAPYGSQVNGSRAGYFFFFSSRRRHTRFDCDWSSDVCSSDLLGSYGVVGFAGGGPLGWLAERLGLEPRGIGVTLADEIGVELDLVVGHGLPIAEVARQV